MQIPAKPPVRAATLARPFSLLFGLSQTTRNVAANFIGTFWTALMGPALVSVYIRLMGIEAYGLVGILTTLQTIFALLDLGLSAATNRELARFSARPERAKDARDLIRTAELIYWSLAALIGVGVIALAPFLSRHWIHPQQITAGTVQQAFLMMGLILACQFPFALYSGGLNGMQRQVLLNVILVTVATLRGGGSVLLLWLVSPTVQVFFAWQLIVTVLQTGITALLLWRNLPRSSRRPQFRSALLRTTGRFAAGMLGISFFSLLLTQTDKIVLSRLLTLEKFGYYSLATVVASSVYLFVAPIFAAVFPRFSQLVAAGAEADLRALYHSSAQLLSTFLLPTALTLALFAPEILTIWLRDPTVVQNVHLLVSLLVIGTALNGLMNVPYALQLAAGWTRLPLYQNIVAVIILLPCLFWATARYGAIGAAWVWIAVNAGYILIGVQVMHTRLLPGEKLRWYLYDVGVPLTGALGVAVSARWLFPTTGSLLTVAGLLAVVSFFGLLVTAMLTPVVRTWLRQRWRTQSSEV